jgi:hypothetical protein
MGKFKIKVVEKVGTQISNSKCFENRTVYEIMWKNIGEPGRNTEDSKAHAHCMLDD